MSTTIHVTRVSGRDVYGHLTSHCDESGCNGHELYFSGIDGTTVSRGEIVESVTLTDAEVACKCGITRDDYCYWTGPTTDTVTVEWMPLCFRASHIAAGNSGSYPHNGAVRLTCERGCAERLIESDPEWAHEVSEVSQ